MLGSLSAWRSVCQGRQPSATGLRTPVAKHASMPRPVASCGPAGAVIKRCARAEVGRFALARGLRSFEPGEGARRNNRKGAQRVRSLYETT